MKKRLSLILALILIFSTFAACGGTPAEGPSPAGEPNQPEQNSDSLVVAITKDENTLTPYTYLTGTPGLDVLRLIYDSLFTFDLDNKIVPWMVEADYEVDEDSKVYTMTLIQGQKWHDGTPLTAEDVKFTFEYPLTQNHSRWKNIANQIERIDVDGDTITFTLKDGNPNFLRSALCDMPIIPKHIYEGVENAETSENTIGSSIYKLAEYKIGEYYVLEAFEDYFKGSATVKTINMPIMTDASSVSQALISKQIAAATSSIAPETIPSFSDVAGVEIISGRNYAPTMLQFNCEREILSDAAFRTALCSAVNIQNLIDVVMMGYAKPGLPGFYTDDMPEARKDLAYHYDSDAANAALDALGYSEKDADGIRLADGKPIAFELLVYANNTLRIRAAELIAEDLKAVGIQVTVSAMEADTADEKIWPGFDVAEGRDYDMAMWGWSAPVQLDPAALVKLGDSDSARGNLNIGGLKDSAYDTLCQRYLGTSKADERSEISKEMQAALTELAPFINLWYADMNYAVNTELYNNWKMQTGSGIINRYSFME